jgi:hypothetical protein
LIIALVVSLFSSYSSAAITSSGAKLPEPEARTVHGLTLQIDPRIELLNIIQYIGKENVHAQMGMVGFAYTDYRLEIDKCFQKHYEHAAVKFYDSIEFNGIDEPTAVMLLMNEDFTVNKDGYDSYKDVYSSRTFGSLAKLQKLFDYFQSFYIDSEFQKFYDSQRAFYKRIINETTSVLPEQNVIGYMEDFFQEKADGYTVNLVTMQMGNYGGSAIVDGKLHLYSTNGPEDFIGHSPVFGNAAYFTELEAHEFGHNFIPVAGENASPITEQIKQSEYLHEAVRDDMGSIAYSNWDSVLEETILRACVVHIMENYDTKQAAKLLQQERDLGFLYIDCVYESIEQYLANKRDYPTFKDFLPVIMKDLMSKWRA